MSADHTDGLKEMSAALNGKPERKREAVLLWRKARGKTTTFCRKSRLDTFTATRIEFLQVLGLQPATLQIFETGSKHMSGTILLPRMKGLLVIFS